MENPKEPSKKLLELINEFSKVSSYKTSIYQLHFYTLIMNNPKIKLRNHSILSIIKMSKINLTRVIQFINTKNYKKLLK